MRQNTAIHVTGRIGLIGAEEHPHAARRLRAALSSLEWREGTSSDLDAGQIPTIELKSVSSLAEGAFSIRVSRDPDAPRVIVEGGPFSGVIYGVEELIQRRTKREGATVAIDVVKVERVPGLTYRTFWTWDHSTNWAIDQIGVQEIGVFNPYSKPPEGFLADYQMVVDFCSVNRIAAVVVYGFLRDSHGGIEAAKALCHYARERGVRILPGIAIGAYGGVYWEGKHRYNLATWLKQNPELTAQFERDVGFHLDDLAFPLSFPNSDYTQMACPSRPENVAWMTEAVEWLVSTFDIGGMNIESGDYGVCGCPLCQARRTSREDPRRRHTMSESWSHSDMADNFPALLKASRARPDLWIYCELQWDNLLDTEAFAPLSRLPPGGIYQHTVNRSYWHSLRHKLTPRHIAQLPTTVNVLRCQFACQWSGDRRTERYSFNGRVLAEMAAGAATAGMQGLTMWGEPSPFHVGAELSYLAFARFSYDPQLTWEMFESQELAPRLGGAEEASRYLAIMEELDQNPVLAPGRLARFWAEAREASFGQSDEQVVRRWLYLEDRIARRRYMGR